MQINIKILSHRLITESNLFELKDINIDFDNRSFAALLGKSGSGKTTLINLLVGLDEIQDGNIKINNRLISEFKQTELMSIVEFVSIDNNYFNDLSVLDNLLIVNSNKEKIITVLDTLKLSGYLNKKASLLSKGEQQRLAIARALLTEKDIVIMDEPTGNLDRKNVDVVFKLLKDLSRSKLVIVATHENELANKYCQHVVELSNGVIVKDEKANTLKDKNTKTKNKLELNNKNRITFKLFFKKIFQNKLTYIVSFFSLLLVLLSSSLLFAFNNINDQKTLNYAFDNLVFDYYSYSDNRYFDKNVPNEYLESNEVVQPFTIGSSNNITIDVIFQDNKTIDLINKDINEYQIDNTKYVNTDKKKYFPIIANKNLIKKIEEERGVFLQIGDLLPMSPVFTNGYDSSYNFVIVDTFSMEGKYNEKSSFFPSIIDKGIYLTFNQEFGINSIPISQKISNVLEEYYESEYAEGHKWVFGYRGRMIKSSLVASEFYTEANVPSSGGFYVVGRLPENDNEIAVSDSFIYELFGPEESNNPNIAAFSQQIDKDLVIGEDSHLPPGTYPDMVKVVGYYSYGTSNTKDELIDKSQIIVSDNLYDKVYTLIEDNYYPGGNINNLIAGKTFIKENYQDFKDEKIDYYDAPEIKSTVLLFKNVLMMSSFLRTLIIILLIVCFVLMFAFIINYLNKLENEISLLLLMGTKKKSLSILMYSALFVSYFVVFMLSIFTSKWFNGIILRNYANFNSFNGQIIYNSNYIYIYLLVIFLCLMIAPIVYIALLSKKRILITTQNE